ncbi:MAG: homocysteine S-methyltransferase family protein [Desulfarculaceae bacterium]|nr:homocysteine S-methyltransferase family protein [Desulfarculaceae bacterium]MCF8071745.1 homocysteine S-methyltransferase family protein [Desulfarculaceae bacterium]MCF8101295.1 homocysteine S-methyltransferase family protein [Desulfarculaceae bacterium]MCF8117254.1 homocysteine S-methyltransferase family protein [Desulfarculaceae bacterium]
MAGPFFCRQDMAGDLDEDHMASEDFAQWLRHEPLILTEFAINERIRRDPGLGEDSTVGISLLLLSQQGREILARIYREYLLLAAKASLPMIIEAPTWRINRVRCRQAGIDPGDMNQRAVDFVRGLASEIPGARVVVAGLMAPAGDAYEPGEALQEEEAFAFHQEQASALAKAGADFLLPATLPALGEAKGLARACETSGLPYLPGLVLGQNGRMLDGTSLARAMDEIDACVNNPPPGYMIICTHPNKVSRALTEQGPLPRLIGLQGNASELSPEELDSLDHVDQGDPEDFGARLADLHLTHGMQILGGCCGTDGRHMKAFIQALAKG